MLCDIAMGKIANTYKLPERKASSVCIVLFYFTEQLIMNCPLETCSYFFEIPHGIEFSSEIFCNSPADPIFIKRNLLRRLWHVTQQEGEAWPSKGLTTSENEHQSRKLVECSCKQIVKYPDFRSQLLPFFTLKSVKKQSTDFCRQANCG